jgi:Ca2+-binding RTX toxin-like protein
VTVAAGATVSIFDLTITRGSDLGLDGGGIHNEGTLSLEDVVVSNSFAFGNGGGIWTISTLRLRRVDVLDNGTDIAPAPDGQGGGLYVAAGTVTIVESRFEGNGARSGGGIYNAGITTIRRSTIHDNSSFTDGGGGIRNTGGNASLTIEDTTLSANTSDDAGGALLNTAEAVLTNSTVSGNSAVGNPALTPGGSALWNGVFGNLVLNNTTVADNLTYGIGNQQLAPNNGGSVTLRNSIVDGNSIADCSGFPITSADFNLDSDNSCNLIAANDQPAAVAGLGALADNGGLTETHALSAGSPAVNNIPAVDCMADTNGDGVVDTNVNRDQRDRTRNLPCDSGSYEYIPELCNGLPATIVAGPTDVVITGTAGNDVILGNDLSNTINAGDGDDTICAGKGNDKIKAGSGDDTVLGGKGNDVIKGQGDNDSLDGGAGNDKIFDGDGDDVTRGGRGKDKHIDGPGIDDHDGGNGKDLLNLKKNSAGAEVDLAATDSFFIGGGFQETATTIESVTGTRFDDEIIGDNLNNTIKSLAGADLVRGGDGNDRISGGADDDDLDGGNGTDTLDGGAGAGDICTNGETVTNCELP